jgi:peptidoglycan hydrolase CwlO-like protein
MEDELLRIILSLLPILAAAVSAFASISAKDAAGKTEKTVGMGHEALILRLDAFKDDLSDLKHEFKDVNQRVQRLETDINGVGLKSYDAIKAEWMEELAKVKTDVSLLKQKIDALEAGQRK